jgi:protein SCO1/2
MVLGAWLAIAPSVHGEPPGTSVYPMRGILRNFDAKTGQATVTHEAVRGYMPAMTMDFQLANPDEMRSLHPGDTFSCQLRVTLDGAWIERVHKEDAPAVLSPFGPAINVSRSSELRVGDPLPDVELTDQHGATMHLHDLGGKPLAISFIYLRCALPTYCPLLNRNFQTACTLLDRLGLQRQAHFLSVSMDPENDTPENLAKCADAYEADQATWTFATASEDMLHRLGDAVGLEFQRQGSGISHNLRTVVVDEHGCIRRVFRGNNWTPQELVAELRAAGSPAQE